MHKLDPSVRNSLLLQHYPSLDPKGFLPISSVHKQKFQIKLTKKHNASTDAVFSSEETSFRTLAEDLHTKSSKNGTRIKRVDHLDSRHATLRANLKDEFDPKYASLQQVEVDNPVLMSKTKVRQSLDMAISDAYQIKNNLKMDRLKMPILTRNRQQFTPVRAVSKNTSFSLQPSPTRLEETALPRHEAPKPKQLFQNEIIKKAEKHKNRLRELDVSY